MSLIPKRRIEDAAATKLQGIPKPTPTSAKPAIYSGFLRRQKLASQERELCGDKRIPKGKALWSTRSRSVCENIPGALAAEAI